MAIALFAISTFALLLPGWLLTNRLFARQPLPGALFYLCLTLFQITVIELILGISNQLKMPGIILLSLMSGAVVLWLAIQGIDRWQKAVSTDSITDFSRETEVPNPGLNSTGILILSLVALVLLIPTYSTIVELFTQIFRVHPLSWDVVSYHLPNALDYLQTSSFWTNRNFFNQYPGGNEILQIWSFLPLQLDILLGITTATLGLGVLLTTTLLLKNVLPQFSQFEWGIWTIILWVLCLSIPPFQDVLFDFGRNDITIALWELVALWSLQQATIQTQHKKWWLLATGVSLGMAIGVKPTGLIYFVGFLGLAFTSFFPKNHHSLRARLLEISQFLMLPVILLGGFWYGRNLLQTGTLSDQNLTRAAAELSIFRSLLNPNLYQINFPFLFLIFSIGVTVIATIICVKNSSPSFKLLTSFNWIAIVALILTPSGAGYWAGDTPFFLIQIRYGVAIVPVTLILLLSMLAQKVEQLKQQNSNFQTQFSELLPRLHGENRSYSTALFLGIINIIGFTLIAFQLITYQPVIGLPGFDSILFVSNPKPSQVYSQVQQNIRNSVIYSIGLRPYGLYGFPFSNQVIARLGSIDWNYQEGLQILRQYQPDFIVFSRDPFSGQVPNDLAVLMNQPKLFEIIYQDPLAAIFRVIPTQPQK
jgi:hypothetical protein